MKWVNRSILILMAGIFIFAGIDKLLHYDGFINALANYAVVPSGTASFLAFPVIVIELVIGIGLLTPQWRGSAALTATIVLAVFTVALFINQLYGERGICGCWFTITLARGTKMHIFQNLILLIFALGIWRDSVHIKKKFI